MKEVTLPKQQNTELLQMPLSLSIVKALNNFMPIKLERKLKKEYGKKSPIPYKIMNKLGYMHGNKETAKGRALDQRTKK